MITIRKERILKIISIYPPKFVELLIDMMNNIEIQMAMKIRLKIAFIFLVIENLLQERYFCAGSV
ncbi:hypothetical protein C7U60_06775 [Mesorhizobium plurifarium]|nr:hypothetical protein C7U60_06775 [Mesorhizobium plurifarium]